jgi:hypothetical protein
MDSYRVTAQFAGWGYYLVCRECHEMRFRSCQGHYVSDQITADLACQEDHLREAVEHAVKAAMREKGFILDSWGWKPTATGESYDVVNVSARQRDLAKLQAWKTGQPLKGSAQ